MYENKILFEIQDYYKKVQQVFLSIFEDLIPESFFSHMAMAPPVHHNYYSHPLRNCY